MNEDGRIVLYVADRTSLHAKRLDLTSGINFAAGASGAYSASGDRLLISHESTTQPVDFWVYDLARRQTQYLTATARTP